MTHEEIYEWLNKKGYQTELDEQGYRMYFDLDMPKILTAFVQEHNASLLSQAGVPRDEEIEAEATRRYGEVNKGSYHADRPYNRAIFSKGGKWMRDRMSSLLLQERQRAEKEVVDFIHDMRLNYWGGAGRTREEAAQAFALWKKQAGEKGGNGER